MKIRYDSMAFPPVHPHGRGDNVSGADIAVITVGSPPRAWGQLSSNGTVTTTTRFTPTGVGTIQCSLARDEQVSVHPHGRGDNQQMITGAAAAIGSPPRAWGQSRAVRSTRSSRRFTPTGVGTICSCRPRNYAGAVHPHGRGDNAVGRKSSTLSAGSPPRAWGQSARER